MFLVSVAILSTVYVIAALLVPAWTDILLLAGPIAVASIFLLLQRLWSQPRSPVADSPIAKKRRRVSVAKKRGQIRPPAATRRRLIRAAAARKWVIIDGSNVMHWRDGDPSVQPLRDVSDNLAARGYSPHFFFDANAGYILADRYLHDQDFERMLNLRRGSVTVVPKGTIADSAILSTARRLNAVVVTNDRYRDWAEQFPEVTQQGFLLKGEYGVKGLRLDETFVQPAYA
ncbi:hypothetical protein [uncultured Aliiroseovarius sp.]|uniref:NYN domain-containing protein n=1 Tax=uncultured Aliiroseovarius sp. TaxID=1658783 RepID=UPI002591438B|nr:hypothetical protein [uncultured Aliiroseovarius sp.]